MKKYLMTGIAALAMGGIITSCSHDMDNYTKGDTTETIKENYENAFISTFGTPAANQTWGFGPSAIAGTRGMTRANPGVDYPATSTGINADANEWADPDKQYGGWVVPDPLTDGQKLRVKAYFQANPNLTYQDPEWRHFFVQQVYKGGTSVGANSSEEVKAADGSVYNSNNMNLMTVGQNEQHINNFNNGTCSTNNNVLDNGGNVNDGPYHSDEIMLMVNIDDTSCFGYHNSGCSLQKNDKAALVAASVIDAWAAQNGNPGEAVVDKWNRSFLGYDLELYTLEQAYAKDGSNLIYAPISDVPGNAPQYVWDGTKVIPTKGIEQKDDLNLLTREFTFWNGSESLTENKDDNTWTFHSASWGGLVTSFGDADLSDYAAVVVEFAEPTSVATQILAKIGNQWSKWDANSYANAGVSKIELPISGNDGFRVVEYIALQADNVSDIKISKFYLKGQEGVEGYGDYIVVNGQQVPFLSTNMNMYGGDKQSLSDGDMKTNQDGKECLNLPKFKELVDDGYLPVKDKNLREWVKWQGGDGYFSDWIVTLSRGKRIGEADDEIESIRVIAEDLNAKESKTFEGGSDFDFNDVVFDVIWNKTQNKVSIKVLADGAEYTMYIGGADEKSVDGLMTVNEMFEAANGRTFSKREYPNTAPGSHDDHNNLTYTPYEFDLDSTEWKGDDIGQIANSILVRVVKSGVLMTLTAPKAGAAAKVAVGTDYDWCDENQFIDAQDKYNGKFARYVKRELGDDWYKSNVE